MGLLEQANQKLDILIGEIEKPEKKEKIKRLAISSNAFHKFVEAKVWHLILQLHSKYNDLRDVEGEIFHLVYKNQIDVDIDSEITYQEMTVEEFIDQKSKLKFTSTRIASILNGQQAA
jgi:hypothetical protein